MKEKHGKTSNIEFLSAVVAVCSETRNELLLVVKRRKGAQRIYSTCIYSIAVNMLNVQ